MTDWRHHAARLDEDPELFFPVSDRGQGTRQVALAKAVCARCRARSKCLAYALDDRLEYGIFGGTTEREWRNLARVKADHRPNRSSAAITCAHLTSRHGICVIDTCALDFVDRPQSREGPACRPRSMSRS